MGTDRKSSWKEARTAERNRQLIMLAVPIVLILLIIIIVVADRSGKDETEPVQTETGTATPSEATETSVDSGETAESTEETADSTGESPEETEVPTAEGETGETHELLQLDAVPEINSLMKEYYAARVACDVVKLYGLYGRTETDVAKIEAAKAKLFLPVRDIKTVDEIVCYSAKMEDQDIWFVLMTLKIYFRSTDTAVPVGADLFVRKDEEGNFFIIEPEELTAELMSFKQEVIRQDKAVQITGEVNKKMKEKIESDPVLLGIYGTLNSGSPLWDTGEEETEPNIEILTE